MAINYHRGMSERGAFVTPEIATGLVRRHLKLEPGTTVTAVRKLYGGSVNRVLELVLDREPASLVAKFNDADAVQHFQAEHATLTYFREHTRLPVPRPIAVVVGDEAFDGSALFMDKVSGTTLEDARLSRSGRQRFEWQLAQHLAELHSHTAERFGPAAHDSPAEHHDRWLELFTPIVEFEAAGARGVLASAGRDVVDHVARHLHHWLDHRPAPTLIHGDLWANNILLNNANPDRPTINAYIDGHATFADPEYELAYLQLFKTAGPYFFERYQQTHRLDAGFVRRSRVYWLVTMLQHCRMFGDKYAPACEQVIRELRAMK